MRYLALVVLCALPALAQVQTIGLGARARPALNIHPLKGPAGDPNRINYLVKDLNWTLENISALLNYLEPYNGGAALPEKNEMQAQKDLLSESDHCDALIQESVVLLPNIVRGSSPASPTPYFLNRPTLAHQKVSSRRLQREVASWQVNVAGHMATLIQNKRAHASPDYKEGNIEGWLAAANKELAASTKRLLEQTQLENMRDP